MSKVTFRSKQPYFQLSYMDVFKVGFITVPVVGGKPYKDNGNPNIDYAKCEELGIKDPDYTEISCNDEARMLGAGFSKPVGGRDHSKHIEELKRKYGGDEDPEYSDLDRKLIAKFRQ